MEIAEAEDDIFFDPYETIYKNNDVNIMSGVIREDHPLNKVLSHFYHAYSGIPLSFSIQNPRKSMGFQVVTIGFL